MLQEAIDNTELTSATTAETRKKTNIPTTDADLSGLCTVVSASWAQNKWLTLKWITTEEFGANAEKYTELLTAKTEQGSDRPQITGKLNVLDKQINTSLQHIKGYLADKYGRNAAPDYYAAFGIVRKGKIFVMPKDRNRRKDALGQMMRGIAQEGFNEKAHGKDFWQEIKDSFDKHLNEATQTDGGVSEKTGNKNTIKQDLRRALNSIILSIKANYPYTWKTELRNWGFQKEKY